MQKEYQVVIVGSGPSAIFAALTLAIIRGAMRDKVNMFFETPVKEILVEGGKVIGVLLDNGSRVKAQCVICGPGRVGAAWIQKEVKRLGIPSVSSPVDIGVRVEAPAPILHKLTDLAYEAKLIYYSKTFDDKVRSFCMNPFGEVVTETIDEMRQNVSEPTFPFSMLCQPNPAVHYKFQATDGSVR